MSLGINDTFPFGKFKGHKVSDVLLSDPGYCCWLREEKKNAGQPRAFDKDANDVIDVAIRQSKSLSKKYKPWGAADADLEAILKNRTEQDEAAAAVALDTFEQRQVAYSGEWGAW